MAFCCANSEVGVAEVQVPTIDRRTRVPLRAIEDTVNQVVLKFGPDKVILFGSHAYGEPRPESDVDLLVIMETPLRETEQAVAICQGIDYHYGLDLIVRTPSNLERRLALGDPFISEICRKGCVLYERANA